MNSDDFQNTESDGARSEERMTWRRPEDGRPVYGVDEGAEAPSEEPALPDEYHPASSSSEPPPQAKHSQWAPPPGSPSQLPPPVLGPAVPPSEGVVGSSYPATPDTLPSANPQAQQHGAGAPVRTSQQPPPTPSQEGQWGPPAPHGYYPPPPPSSGGKSNGALVVSILGLIFAFCCIPLGIVLGVIGTAMAREPRRRARDHGYRDDSAGSAYWIGIAALVVGVLHLMINILIMVFYPDLVNQMLRDLGLM